MFQAKITVSSVKSALHFARIHGSHRDRRDRRRASEQPDELQKNLENQ
ncbi:MAG: hypothetical protein N838_19825 [Thiohalocapsa sp. PB-PSB1]|nr:MAG: hypothetical protein N838_19825 [Thiohalocapsa sp. PB-PSB1]